MEQAVALIGFGEAGSTFARAADWGVRARGFDLLPARRAAMAEAGVAACASAGAALEGAPLVLSLVTADQALAASSSPNSSRWPPPKPVRPRSPPARSGAT